MRSLDRVAQTHNLCTTCMKQKNRTYKRVYAKVDTSELSFFLNVNRLNMDNCMFINTDFLAGQWTHFHTEFISLIYLYLDLPDVGCRVF